MLLVKSTKALDIGVPTFPVLSRSSRLVSFVGKQSWLLFDVLKIGLQWLAATPSKWEKDDEFQKAADLVRHLKVLNDLVERAIKLITDFAHSITNDEIQKQYLLQVVESYRRKIRDFRKKL